MTSPEAGNPFAAPHPHPTGTPGTRRPAPRRQVIRFAWRRVLLLVGIPGGLAALYLATRQVLYAATALATLLFFLPTTTIITWDRFFARVTDDRPVPFATGEVLDRPRYRRIVVVNLVERMGLAMLLLVLGIAVAGTPMGLLAVFLVLFALWNAWYAVLQARLSGGLLALIEEDYQRTVDLVGPILRWPQLNRTVQGTASLQAGTALIRLERTEQAIEALRAARGRNARQAHLLRAGLLAGQGRVDEAKRALEHRPARSLGERLALENALAAIALEEGRPADVLERVPEWDALLEGLPAASRNGLDLIEAAARALAGDPEGARAVLERTGARLALRPWTRSSMPRVYDALVDLGEPP